MVDQPHLGKRERQGSLPHSPLAGDQRDYGNVGGISRDTPGGAGSACDAHAPPAKGRLPPLYPNLLALVLDMTFSVCVNIVGHEDSVI